MAHGLESSRSMFSVKETPWHKLGVQLEEAPTVADGIRQAGLDWKVETWPLTATDPEGRIHKVPDKAVFRTSDSRYFATVGPLYTPVQNEHAFDFFDASVAAGEMTLETAGSLSRGRRIWILARLKGDPVDVVPGDAIRHYLLLANGHDGTMSLHVGPTDIRVVCANTMAMAIADGELDMLRLVHREGITEGLKIAEKSFDISRRRFDLALEDYRYLASKQVIGADMYRLFVQKSLFPIKFHKDPKILAHRTEVMNEKVDEVMQQLTRIFEGGRGNDLAKVRGTYWGAYNAVSEYLSYDVGRSEATRLNSLWFGEGGIKNRRALVVAKEMATA